MSVGEPTSNPAQAFEGQRFTGTVLFYSTDKGFGVIDCPDTKRLLGSDVTLLPGNLKGVIPQPRELCQFSLKKGRDRGWQAVDVIFQASRSNAMLDAQKDMAMNQQYHGKIVQWEPSKGFGFIHCESLQRIFQKDIFFLRTQLKGELVTAGELNGTTVQFTLERKGKGPQATNVELPGGGSVSRQADELATQVHQGTILQFNQSKGFGFISCDALKVHFSKDVFFMKTELRGKFHEFPPGTEVEFTFHLVNGRPQCTNVARAGMFQYEVRTPNYAMHGSQPDAYPTYPMGSPEAQPGNSTYLSESTSAASGPVRKRQSKWDVRESSSPY